MIRRGQLRPRPAQAQPAASRPRPSRGRGRRWPRGPRGPGRPCSRSRGPWPPSRRRRPGRSRRGRGHGHGGAIPGLAGAGCTHPLEDLDEAERLLERVNVELEGGHPLREEGRESQDCGEEQEGARRDRGAGPRRGPGGAGSGRWAREAAGRGGAGRGSGS